MIGKQNYNPEYYNENVYTKQGDYYRRNRIFDINSENQTVNIIKEIYEVENIIGELKNAKLQIQTFERKLKENQNKIDKANENIKKPMMKIKTFIMNS